MLPVGEGSVARADWEGGSLYTKEEVQGRIAEYVLGAVKGKVAYFNFLLDVTPECDGES